MNQINRTSIPIYVLVVQDAEGGCVRWNTAEHTDAGRESLQEQADKMMARAWVQTDWRVQQ